MWNIHSNSHHSNDFSASARATYNTIFTLSIHTQHSRVIREHIMLSDWRPCKCRMRCCWCRSLMACSLMSSTQMHNNGPARTDDSVRTGKFGIIVSMYSILSVRCRITSRQSLAIHHCADGRNVSIYTLEKFRTSKSIILSIRTPIEMHVRSHFRFAKILVNLITWVFFNLFYPSR